MPKFDPTQPPDGAGFRETPDGFIITASARSKLAFFAVSFAVVWDVLVIDGLLGLGDGSAILDFGQTFVAVIFLVGAVVLTGFAILKTVGSLRVEANGVEGRIFLGVGPVGRTQKFNWRDITSAKIIEKQPRKEPKDEYRDVNQGSTPQAGKPRKFIELQGHTPIVFAAEITEERRAYVLEAILYMLEKKDRFERNGDA